MGTMPNVLECHYPQQVTSFKLYSRTIDPVSNVEHQSMLFRDKTNVLVTICIFSSNYSNKTNRSNRPIYIYKIINDSAWNKRRLMA